MNENNRPLWAPWRIEFIRGEKENRCFLCNHEKIDKNSPEESLIVYRGEHTFVILNRYPYNSGHLLIVPYRHIGDLTLLTKEERIEIFDLCIEAELTLRHTMNPMGFNVGFNLGVAGGAGVADHIHMHIVPRWNGDNNFMPVLADIRCVPEALEETAKLIRNSWQKEQ